MLDNYSNNSEFSSFKQLSNQNNPQTCLQNDFEKQLLEYFYSRLKEQEETYQNQINKLNIKIKSQQDQIKQQNLTIQKLQIDLSVTNKQYEQYQIQLKRQISQERAKSQNTLKAAQGLKIEYDKKYCLLMDEVIRSSKRTGSVALNSSFSQSKVVGKLDINQISQAMLQENDIQCSTAKQDISNISNIMVCQEKLQDQSNIQLSALNKFLDCKENDETQKSFNLNVNVSQSINPNGRKISISEKEVSKLYQKSSGGHNNSQPNLKQLKLVSNQYSDDFRRGNLNNSPKSLFPSSTKTTKQPLNQQKKKKLSIDGSYNQKKITGVDKTIKSYKFNLCDLEKLTSQTSKQDTENNAFQQYLNPEFQQSLEQKNFAEIDQNQQSYDGKTKQLKINLVSNKNKNTKNEPQHPNTSRKANSHGLNISIQRKHNSVHDVENFQRVPDEGLEINRIGQSKKCEQIQNKEQRLNTNTRFNSLLKVI